MQLNVVELNFLLHFFPIHPPVMLYSCHPHTLLCAMGGRLFGLDQRASVFSDFQLNFVSVKYWRVGGMEENEGRLFVHSLPPHQVLQVVISFSTKIHRWPIHIASLFWLWKCFPILLVLCKTILMSNSPYFPSLKMPSFPPRTLNPLLLQGLV
jgi:hypothetical protein